MFEVRLCEGREMYQMRLILQR